MAWTAPGTAISWARMIADQSCCSASSTTEGGGGGRSAFLPKPRSNNPRAASCCCANASVVDSYHGAQADAVVTTARRDANADASDQVLVVFDRRRIIRWKRPAAGTRWECAAPAAPASASRRWAIPPRSCRCPMASFTARAWCRPRRHLMWAGDLGRHCGQARWNAFPQIYALRQRARAAICRRACRISPRRWRQPDGRLARPDCRFAGRVMKNWRTIPRRCPRASISVEDRDFSNLLKVDASRNWRWKKP